MFAYLEKVDLTAGNQLRIIDVSIVFAAGFCRSSPTESRYVDRNVHAYYDHHIMANTAHLIGITGQLWSGTGENTASSFDQSF